VKKNIYLFLTFLGLLFPYYFIFKFYSTEHVPTLQAITGLFSTNMSAAFNADLLMSVLAAWTFMIFEGRRINMKNWWLFLPAALIGLSFALPLFLYFRERHLENKK
jgi:Terpene cyclase DEP1